MDIGRVGGFNNSQHPSANRVNGGVFSAPPWNIIPSKGQNKLSDEEMNQRIDELALKWAGAKTDRQIEALHQSYYELEASYLSDIAPDRKLMVKEAQSALKDFGGDIVQGRSTKPMTIFDYIALAKEKKLKINKDNCPFWDLPSGGTVTATPNAQYGHSFAIEKENSGKMEFTSGQWVYERTVGEHIMAQDFQKMFKAAVAAHSDGNTAPVRSEQSDLDVTVYEEPVGDQPKPKPSDCYVIFEETHPNMIFSGVGIAVIARRLIGYVGIDQEDIETRSPRFLSYIHEGFGTPPTFAQYRNDSEKQ